MVHPLDDAVGQRSDAGLLGAERGGDGAQGEGPEQATDAACASGRSCCFDAYRLAALAPVYSTIQSGAVPFSLP